MSDYYAWRSATLYGDAKAGPDRNRRLPFWELPTPPLAGRSYYSKSGDAYGTYIKTAHGVGTSGMNPVSDWSDEETDDPHCADRRISERL